MSFYYVLASFILAERSVSFNVTGLFFLFIFKIFSLSLVFSSLVIMCLGMAFFVFICFVSAKFFYIWGLKSFFSFGHYIFNLFFCSIISLFFKTYSYIYIGLFSISSLVLHILVGFCGFFFFPVGSNLGNSHWPVFCCIQSSVKPSQWIFLFQLLSYSAVDFSLRSYLKCPFLCWNSTFEPTLYILSYKFMYFNNFTIKTSKLFLGLYSLFCLLWIDCLTSFLWITLSYFFACHILILLVGHCGICVLEAVDYKSFSL